MTFNGTGLSYKGRLAEAHETEIPDFLESQSGELPGIN